MTDREATMSGCFGNDPEDRAREKELDDYLNSLDWSDDDDEEAEDDVDE